MAIREAAARWPYGPVAVDGGRRTTATRAAGRGAEVAKLDYTLKDMNGPDVRLADFKGGRCSSTSGRPGAAPASTRFRRSSSWLRKHTRPEARVLGISTDDKPEDLRPFAAQYKMNYPVLVGLGHDDLLEHYEPCSPFP